MDVVSAQNKFTFNNVHHHHHQPINVPTAGAQGQVFFMDYPQGERAITHHAQWDWWVLTTVNTAGTNG
jgi:hypothetical protein